MNVNPLQVVRGTQIDNFGQGTPQSPQITPRGESLVAQATAALQEYIRQGQSWSKLSDEVVCVTAVPTTTASFALWNGEPQGGKCYIIDSLAWVCTTSAGAASKFAMVVQLDSKLYTAQPATADTATGIFSRSGRGAYSGRAKSSKTVTVLDSGWMPVGNSIETALTATGGAQIEAQINGGLILQPQQLLCVAVIAVNNTAAGKVSYRWTEMPLPIEG